MHPAGRLITIGTVLRTKGIDGVLRVQPLTFDPQRFHSLREVYFEKNGALTEGVIEDVTVSPGCVFLKIEGIERPEETATYAGSEIKIPESESPRLPEGMYYHYQIIGLDVYTTRGIFVGKVKQIIETGSNDVYSVVERGKETLVPAIAEVIEEINLEENRITIKEIEGLLDAV
jgi:16S rRNA processing protein RimM